MLTCLPQLYACVSLQIVMRVAAAQRGQALRCVHTALCVFQARPVGLGPSMTLYMGSDLTLLTV